MAAPWPEPGTWLELRRPPSPGRGRCSERTAWPLTSSAGRGLRVDDPGQVGFEHRIRGGLVLSHARQPRAACHAARR